MFGDAAPNPALLPAGLHDLLPPEAEREAAGVEAVMAAFAAHGYERVKPPLLEFEEGLFSGSGAAVAEQTFRVMDPDSQRMMGVRADMTPQVARIAATRLKDAPRPLRLSYAGQCLRVRGTQLAPDRQVAQAGIELFGPDSPDADAEMVLVAADALAALGLTRISFDLTLPPLAETLLDGAGIEGQRRAQLLHALDRKDAAAVARLGGASSDLLTELLTAAGAADAAMAVLRGLELPGAASILVERLIETVAAIRARAPALRLTLDPIELRGFRYHTGICVFVFALGYREELGRGGRYLCGDGEPATGLTLFPEAVLRAAPARAQRPKAYIPYGALPADVARLRGQGFATVAALGGPDDDPVMEARRLGCAVLLRNDGEAVRLEGIG